MMPAFLFFASLHGACLLILLAWAKGAPTLPPGGEL